MEQSPAQPTPRQDTHPKTKLVTVHGTGSGHKDDNGDRWWQRDSAFLKALEKRLELDPTRVEIVPFHWKEGPNSETERRVGGAELYEKLKGYDKQGADYYLIGHSHGGSVIHGALLQSIVKKNPLERLKTWCTIGTPFVDYRPNRFLFNRLGTTGLTVYATAVGALMLAAGLIVMSIFAATPFWRTVNETLGKQAFMGLYAPIVGTLVFYGASCLLLLYAFVSYRGGWHEQSLKKKVEATYADRWLGLYHRDDEAIGALANAAHLKGEIVPSSFLVPLMAAAPLLLTVLGVIALGIHFLTDQSPVSPGTKKFLAELKTSLDAFEAKQQALSGAAAPNMLATTMSGVKTLGTTASITAAVVALYMGLTAVAVMLLKFIAGWVGGPLARAIDNLVWSSVKQSTWGDDRTTESVQQAGSHPSEFAQRFAALPDEVAAKISGFSERNAVKTLVGLRRALATSSPDAMAELSKNLALDELIHTTYFDVPEFQDLAAYSLHKAGLADLKPDHWASTQRDQAQQWLGAIGARMA